MEFLRENAFRRMSGARVYPRVSVNCLRLLDEYPGKVDVDEDVMVEFLKEVDPIPSLRYQLHRQSSVKGWSGKL